MRMTGNPERLRMSLPRLGKGASERAPLATNTSAIDSSLYARPGPAGAAPYGLCGLPMFSRRLGLPAPGFPTTPIDALATIAALTCPGVLLGKWSR